jgi:hypothetical protein
MPYPITEEQTDNAYLEYVGAPYDHSDQDQSHPKWRKRLLRALCYCSTVAAVPFDLLAPRAHEDDQ